MRKGLVSDTKTGKHPNARSGAQQIDASGTPVSQGVHVGRNHEHGSRANVELVRDSPPYVPPVVIRCAAIRTDGAVCQNEVRVAGEKCFGHRAGRGASNG